LAPTTQFLPTVCVYINAGARGYDIVRSYFFNMERSVWNYLLLVFLIATNRR